jgi:hypothetical protein
MSGSDANDRVSGIDENRHVWPAFAAAAEKRRLIQVIKAVCAVKR